MAFKLFKGIQSAALSMVITRARISNKPWFTCRVVGPTQELQSVANGDEFVPTPAT